MNPGLLDLILFSEKRKAFLLLLKEEPKNIDEILKELPDVPRTSLLPQIKKLKEQNLVTQEEGIYYLTNVGEIIVEKMRPFLDTLDVFERNGEFWSDRKLTPIPFPLLRKISQIKNYSLIEPDLSHAFDLNPEFVKYISDSSHVYMFLSYFHPQFPSFFLNLSRKGIELTLVLKDAVYLRFVEDFKKEGEEFLKTGNSKVLVFDKNDIEIPAVVAVSDKIMIMGLFNENGRFDRQYITCFEPAAIKWGEELFKNYMEMANEVETL
jgi:predicted transcriptional regulator